MSRRIFKDATNVNISTPNMSTFGARAGWGYPNSIATRGKLPNRLEHNVLLRGSATRSWRSAATLRRVHSGRHLVAVLARRRQRALGDKVRVPAYWTGSAAAMSRQTQGKDIDAVDAGDVIVYLDDALALSEVRHESANNSASGCPLRRARRRLSHWTPSG